MHFSFSDFVYCAANPSMVQFSPAEIWNITQYRCHSQRKLQYEDLRVCRCQSEDRFMFLLMKTKYPVHIMMFGMVIHDGGFMAPFIFLQSLTLNTEAYIKFLAEVVGATSSYKTLRHATQARESNVGRQNISATTTPLSYLSLQISIPLIIKHDTKGRLKITIPTVFTNLIKKVVGKVC